MLVDNPDIRIISCQRELLSRWNHPNLCAPYWRFYWNPVAGASVRLDNERVSLTPETCVSISPNTSFASHSPGPTEQFYLHFQAASPYDRVRPGIFPFGITPDLRCILDRASLVIAGDPGQAPHMPAFCQYIAAFAVMQVPVSALGQPPTDPRVNRVIAYMHDNLGKAISNQHLARMARMNPNSFIRLFKSQTGISPRAYLLGERIRKAALMLRTSAVSIEEIADALGFSDRYHFSKTFKKHLGLGPAMFRRTRG